jgi:hypothetical protein
MTVLRKSRINLLVGCKQSLGLYLVAFTLFVLCLAAFGQQPENTLSPLLSKDHAVDWWFVFKFNSHSFPGCASNATRACLFGGTTQPYRYFSQQFIFASSESASLQIGAGCLGDSEIDPVGATFGEVYSNAKLHFVIWNDQFYDDPPIPGCSNASCGSPWGHSKGMLAWNDSGAGLAIQVSTPSWPAAGNSSFPRKHDGNTLGCVKDDDVEVSQHFFALRLEEADVLKVLAALENASVVTDPTDPQVVNNGGPDDIQQLVHHLGTQSKSADVLVQTLSSGVKLISKPSQLHVPPWQMVSAVLGGVPLKTATWWATPYIPTSRASTTIKCWDPSLAKPGAVEVATTGHWNSTDFGLAGGLGTNFNHAKIGVSTSGPHQYAIFGDMNQQGTLNGPNCGSSQNGRGGLFYVVEDSELAVSVASLITGNTASTVLPSGKKKLSNKVANGQSH